MTWRTLAVALAAWGAAGLGIFNGSLREDTAASIAQRTPAAPEPALVTTAPPIEEAAAGETNPPKSLLSTAGVSATEVPAVASALTAPGPKAERSPAALEPVVATTATRVRVAAAGDAIPSDPVASSAAVSTTEAASVEPVLTDPVPTPPPATGMQLASVPTSGAVDDALKPAARSKEPSDQCVTDACIDTYLWSLYERTPKIDTNKLEERVKATVKKNGKTRTVTRTDTKYVTADFAWKDPAAAERSGMSLKDYVIGGMDRGFRLRLYGALRAMDDAGLMPGITSAFRDDYRQSIAAGLKAASDSSYHGGSRRGGYGHGLAADLVSLKGDTRAERSVSSDELWQWIDAHEKELGIGRPYRDRDPPHVGPIDGTEYTVKRAGANAKKHGLQAKKMEKPRLETNPAKPSKLSSLQKR
jgi:hypothetical protein